jgi:hypothetical protein
LGSPDDFSNGAVGSGGYAAARRSPAAVARASHHRRPIGIFENTALSFEYRNDSDYSEREGATGDDGNSFVAQLAVEF